MNLAVVIANYDRRELLRECLHSLEAGGERPTVVVVDNGSSDGSPLAARQACPGAEVLALPHNTGFSHAYNVGIRRALALGAEGVLVLNNDTRVAPGALAALAAAAELDAAAEPPRRVGMVAARVVLGAGGATLDGQTLDGTGQRITRDGFGKLVDAGLPADVADAPRETFCPYGAAAFFRRELL